MISDALDLLLLFAVSLLAGSLFPAQSEVVLAGMHLTGQYNTAALVAVATLGNVLGACVGWLLGCYIEHFKNKRWFPVSPNALEKASRHFARYGVWSLLFTWVPVVGDPLTLIAGVLRTRFSVFLLLVATGKLLRYVFVVTVF